LVNILSMNRATIAQIPVIIAIFAKANWLFRGFSARIRTFCGLSQPALQNGENSN